MSQGFGLSYPLILSFSRGIYVPLLQDPAKPKFNFGRMALHASVDVGIGGGMAAAGVFIPVKATGTTLSAVNVKAAVLRPWLVNLGPQRSHAYKGILVEPIQAAAGMAGKYGVGFFKSNEPMQSKHNRFVYLYAGFGI